MSLDFGFERVLVAFKTHAELESIWQSKFFIRNESLSFAFLRMVSWPGIMNISMTIMVRRSINQTYTQGGVQIHTVSGEGTR
jgi:hypothetical protein